MRVVVCIKHVPDVLSVRRIENGRLVRGEDDTLNELDENAIEAAVQLVEDQGGEVIAITMGPEGAEDCALLALQKGADRAVVMTDDRLAGSDAVGTAHVLAGIIHQLSEEAPIDLVFAAMASVDGMTSMLPAALGACLQWPVLGVAHEIEVSDGRVEIARSADGFNERLAAPLPVVVSVTDQVNEPRYPNFKAMKAARTKPLDIWSLDDLAEVDMQRWAVGEEGAGTQILSASEDSGERAGRIVNDSGNGGEQLAGYIQEVVK